MGLKIQRIIFAILTILTFIIIFIFSNQNGYKSKSTSKNFTRKVIEILQIDKNLSESQKEKLIEDSQYIVRKTAHFTIYTIASLNIMIFINTYNIKFKNKILIAFIIAVIYAITDEIHQIFTGTRTPKVLDVLIDSAGVLYGIGIFLLFNMIIRKITKKNEKIGNN